MCDQEDWSHVSAVEMSNDYCAVVAEVDVGDDVHCVWPMWRVAHQQMLVNDVLLAR